jgi:hypothetical protein
VVVVPVVVVMRFASQGIVQTKLSNYSDARPLGLNKQRGVHHFI